MILEEFVATYIAEVILGQHGVSRVTASVIIKDDVLLILAALNDLRRTSTELVLDLLDDGYHERRHDGEDELRELVLQLLYNLGEDGNFLNSFCDGHQDLIMELNGWHDLLEDALDVTSVLLRLTRRDRHLLHLSGLGIVLDVGHLGFLVITTEQAVRDLVKKVLKDTSVSTRAVLQSALELLNLVLSELVRY